jgi:hypothetical protein
LTPSPLVSLVSDLQKIMAESRDYDELLFAWQGWRNASGRELRQDYKRYVQLANKAAALNGNVFKHYRPIPKDVSTSPTASICLLIGAGRFQVLTQIK